MKRKPKVYVETSVISNLTSRLSDTPKKRAMQIATREWWARRNEYELFISRYVEDEIQKGDSAAAERRIESVAGIKVLPATESAAAAAHELVRLGAIPAKCLPDALHIALAACNKLDYIVTWNHKHMSRDERRKTVEEAVARLGLKVPKIVTPGFQKGDRREEDKA